MPSSSEQVGLAGSGHRSTGHSAQGTALDGVVFNTDPLFVRAGNGRAVPRGLSGVEHDMNAQPVLRFKSGDPYSSFAEMSRRASAAKEMQAALKAQIAAKRTIAKRRVSDEDHFSDEAAQQAAQSAAEIAESGGLTRRKSSLSKPLSQPLILETERCSPESQGADATPTRAVSSASAAQPGGSVAVAARRAMAAKELKQALEAQMQAKMMLETVHDDDRLNAESSVLKLDESLGTGSLMEYSATNLAAWEQAQEEDAVLESRSQAMAQSGVVTAWQQQLRQQRRASTPANLQPSRSGLRREPSAAGRASRHSPIDGVPGFGRQSHRPSTTGSTTASASPDLRTPPMRASASPSPPTRAVSSDPNDHQQPVLHFRSDNLFATSDELLAKAASQSQMRAALDEQIAEKQARLAKMEAEQEANRRRSPLHNETSGTIQATSATLSATGSAVGVPGVSQSSISLANISAGHDWLDGRASTPGGGLPGVAVAATASYATQAVSEESPAPSTRQHSARENEAPDSGGGLPRGGSVSDSMLQAWPEERSPLMPTQVQRARPEAPVQYELHVPKQQDVTHPAAAAEAQPAAPPAPAPGPAPETQGPLVCAAPTDAQRARDQEEVYRAWQRAHEEAEAERKKRMRRHAEIAHQARREAEEAAKAASEREAAARALAAKAVDEAAADAQGQQDAAAGMVGGGAEGKSSMGTSGGTGASTSHGQPGPAVVNPRSVAAIVPSQNKSGRAMQAGAQTEDAVVPRKGFLCCFRA